MCGFCELILRCDVARVPVGRGQLTGTGRRGVRGDGGRDEARAGCPAVRAHAGGRGARGHIPDPELRAVRAAGLGLARELRFGLGRCSAGGRGAAAIATAGLVGRSAERRQPLTAGAGRSRRAARGDRRPRVSIAAVTASTGTTDVVVGAMLLFALLFGARPAASSGVLALAAWFKLAPAPSAPLWLARAVAGRSCPRAS